MQQIPFIDLFKIGSTCFGRQTRPFSGALFDCIYSIHVEPILKKSINGICCILLAVYIVVLMMHGLTNIVLFLNLSYSGGGNKIQ